MAINGANEASNASLHDKIEKHAAFSALLSAINEGARANQISNVFMVTIGLYISATAISTSDLDILKSGSIHISQLGGASIPTVLNFALGPLLFVGLHGAIIYRYKRLVERVWLLCEYAAGGDRAICRNLLANNEFILVHAEGYFTHGHSQLLDRVIVFANLSMFPIIVLMTVQIGFLRYQSAYISCFQSTAMFVDLVFIVMFYIWLRSNERPWARRASHGRPGSAIVAKTAFGFLWTSFLLVVLPSAIVLMNIFYIRVPGEDTQTVRRTSEEVAWWEQPLDLVTCPKLGWGCRYLRLNNTTLVKEGDVLSARNRSLRFADFNQSRVEAAAPLDLQGSDLRYATFWRSSFPGALLAYANLSGANLEEAQLNAADLFRADLRAAYLIKADLFAAKLQEADLRGADLRYARLVAANLSQAKLQGANVESALLQFADLSRAQVLQLLATDARTSGTVDLFRADLEVALTSGEKDAIATILDHDPNRHKRLGPKFFPHVVPASDSEEKKSDLMRILLGCGSKQCASGGSSFEENQYVQNVSSELLKDAGPLATAVAIRVLGVVHRNDAERDEYLEKLVVGLRRNPKLCSLSWQLDVAASDLAQQESGACPKPPPGK